MVRARIPAGRLAPEQYLALEALADRHANGTLRLTTRQAVQLHGVPNGLEDHPRHQRSDAHHAGRLRGRQPKCDGLPGA